MIDEPNGEMTHEEFLKAQFFASEKEMEELKQARLERERHKARKSSIRALGKFVKVLQQLDPAEQRAHILWLADKFLGRRI